MPGGKTSIHPSALAATPKGRIPGLLASLEDRWDSLSAEQQPNALGLLAELSAAVLRREARRLKVD